MEESDILPWFLVYFDNMQAKQKHSSSGVVLGNDVLTLDVEGGIDHSLIMAFVTVFGLICGKMWICE